MKKLKLNIYLLNVLLILSTISCSKTWDDHYTIDDGVKNMNILQYIAKTSELSTFYNLLKETGYDKELETSKDFMVWAPDNAALASIDENIFKDTAKLKALIGYYINFNTTLSVTANTRVKMLNGKYTNISISSSEINEANIIKGSGIICKNGIIRRIDKAYLPKSNIWDLIQKSGCSKLINFLNSQEKLIFDIEHSKAIGVNEQTGQTIYDSTWIWRNAYKSSIADISSEDNEYTFIALNDDAFAEGETMYSPYFKLTEQSQTSAFTQYNVCSDLVVNRITSNFTDSIISTTGVLMSLSPFIITDSIEASNGKIYIVKFFPFNATDKFKPMIIEGEKINAASHITWSIRKAEDASGGLDAYFNLIADASSWLQYNVAIPYPAKYEFYWVAVGTSINLKQFLSLYNFNPSKETKPFFSFQPVATKKLYGAEVLLGEYTFNEAKQISIRLTADPNVTTYVTLDYIKMVPVK